MEKTIVNQVSHTKPTDVVQALKAKAIEDEAFKAVCYKFGFRVRSRNQITVRTLMLTMQKDGFNFPLSKYQEILQFLSFCDIGKLVTDRKGVVRALIDIRLTLQSIGKAALEDATLKPFRQAYKYKKLDTGSVAKYVAARTINVDPQSYKTELKINVDGVIMTYPGISVKPEELGTFLLNFSRLNKKTNK